MSAPHDQDPMTALDGCPAPACDNTETPRAYAVLDDGYMAAYVCSACGWEWVTDYRQPVSSGDVAEVAGTMRGQKSGPESAATDRGLRPDPAKEN